ncbi:ribonuclease activity regulator RraA [bacterium]|nr:ribonuclease activity regulator RraA [bacterium]
MSKSESDYSDIELPRSAVSLPIDGGPVSRPDPTLYKQLEEVSSATASAMMHRLGVRQTFIEGPLQRKPGTKVVGPAVTLSFMPQREDVYSGKAQEGAEKRSALWAVFDTVEPGDVLCIQAFGNLYTGCLGEMLATYFKGRGGTGIVVDGCVRDWPQIQQIDVGLWTVGFTPNYASQAHLAPWAYNVPVTLNNVLVLPGDVIIADDDGAVVVPQQMIPLVLEHTLAHEEWEVFSRIKLAEGGALSKYYPLNEEGWAEYEAWKKSNE